MSAGARIATGLIGYGLGGRTFHAPLIAAVPRLRLAAIATRRAGAVAADWPDVTVREDAAALIADPTLDLIVIATPNDTHAPLARAALAAGKHVVIDKPFAVDAAEGEGLIALAADQRRCLSVFHNRRWDGDFLTVQHLLAARAIGLPTLYEARWDRFRLEQRASWKDRAGRGAGLLADLGPHLIDQALLLFGAPDAIQADLAVQREHGFVEDYFEVTLHYGAMRAILSAATIVPAPRPRFAVHGTAGSFVKSGLDPQEDALGTGMRPDDPEYGMDPPAGYGTLTPPGGAGKRIITERGDYRQFYEGMAAATLDGASLPVDPADAVTGLRLIDHARRSAAEGRRITL